jgi:hypothetical protein
MDVGLVFNRAAQFALTIFSKTRLEYKPDVHFLDSKSACALTSLDASDDTQALYWVKRHCREGGVFHRA